MRNVPAKVLPRLKYLLAAGTHLPRDFTEDVVVEVTHPAKQSFVFPKGSRLIIDMVAAGASGFVPCETLLMTLYDRP